MLPAIFGLSGATLSADERAFFRDADPAGFILFARNCEGRTQLRALTDALREVVGRENLAILIDQEGGRVARLRPPEWPEFPAQARFAALYEKAPISAMEAARVNAEALAVTLSEVGITVNCLPLLDIPQPGADEIIGDRAMGHEPLGVAALGRAVLDGLEAGGCIGVVKHVPGHGRALADSHKALPVVDAGDAALEQDIAPFRALNDAPMAMMSHLLYRAWDAERPASLSPTIIADIVRERIGFDGFLLSDDIGMEALLGPAAERARAVVDAGCDAALHCSGDLAEAESIAASLGAMSEEGERRLAAALTRTGKSSPHEMKVLAEKRDALLAYA